MARISANITNKSITFFARGRPWTMASDSPNFAEVKRIISSGGDIDLNHLIGLVDGQVALKQASDGQLTFGPYGEILFNGKPIPTHWEMLLQTWKEHSKPLEAMVKALTSLEQNPSESVRKTLPEVFYVSRLGFMPDGRITALAVVCDDYSVLPDRMIKLEIGKHVEVHVKDLTKDGIRVGAIGYMYSNSYDLRPMPDHRRVVLVAIWPRDVMITDLMGKMVVSALDVIDEVDETKINQLIADENMRIIRGYDHAIAA